MENRKTFFVVPLKIYPYKVIFSFGQTDIDLRKMLKSHKVSIEDNLGWESDNRVEGNTTIFSSQHVLIRVEGYPTTPHDFNILHHELFHAVCFILTDIGMKLTEDSVESYSYLIGHLTEQIYKQLKIKVCQE